MKWVLLDMKRVSSLCQVVVLALCSGCDVLDPGDCVAIAGFALNVVVQDSITGMTPPPGTRVIAQDGTFADSLIGGVPNPAGSAFPLAVERPGSYVVTVEAPAYRLWSRSGIVVARSSAKCHKIQTVTVLARLQHKLEVSN